MSFTKKETHTTEAILRKLKSDLTDYERASFLQVMLDSTNTSELLFEVASIWQKELLTTLIEIEKLKESKRVYQIAIELGKKYETCYEDYEVQINENKVKAVGEQLDKLQYKFDESSNRANKTFELLKLLVEEYQRALEHEEGSFEMRI